MTLQFTTREFPAIPIGTAGDSYPPRTRYYINDVEISAFEQMQLAHMNNVASTLKSILKELRKMNAAPKHKNPASFRQRGTEAL